MRIFMTGGAGFLGRAIMRRATLFSPDPIDFTVYSRDEAKQAKARSQFPNASFILGDVRDLDRMELAMGGHDIVIHAAAMKYVPQGEVNVWETMAVNVDGSANVALAAARTGVRRVVSISTDKACRPVNVYGMSKLVMERMLQEADTWETKTQFNVVRYGNVVASTGSVIPIFRQQAREGRLTLTDPGMTRFWISVESAVRLISDALREKLGGTILVPRLPSATMKDVAMACALVEGVAIPNMVNIGQRFGEKVHEDLLSNEERVYAVERPGAAMLLHPVSAGIQDGHVEIPYNSNTPDGFLDVDDMAALIRQMEDGE